MPSTIKATLTGNASSATAFSAAKAVTLTGDVTGTASSTAGWSVATTLKNSGVTAGTYRSVTVNAKGLITAGTNPTTLSGYGITDAKIASGVITLGSNTITPLTAHQSLSAYAKLASPALTDTPTAPTAALGTNTTQIATTAFVYQNAARILNADTTIYVAQAKAGTGNGSSAANAMTTDDMWKYLASVRMIPAAGARSNSKVLTIKFVPNGTTSYGDITFDANKMPGVRNLVIDMSGTTATTTSNYTTNCPTFGNIYVLGGNLHVTMKNINATGLIQAEWHGRIILNTFIGATRFIATIYGRMELGNGIYAIKNAGTDYLAKGTDYGQMFIVTKTANFHFMEQCYYTGGIYFSDTSGRLHVRHDYIKLTGTQPVVALNASGTKTCTVSTAAGTAAKVGTLVSGQTFTLAKNAVAYVTFNNTNTAANPTLNINSTGAKAIWFNGAAIPAKYLCKYIQYKFTYDGTHYVCNNTFQRVEVASTNSYFARNGAATTTYNSGTFNWTGFSTWFGNGANVAAVLYGNVTGNLTGNASTATTLATARDINISDADGTNSGTKISFNGSANGTIKLPATIKANITGNASGSSGSCTGNAASATKLATARTIGISGGATGTATSFNGTANITIPVTALDVSKANAGTLAVARGGTGLTSLSTFVRTTGNQEIDGDKTFNGVTKFGNASVRSDFHDYLLSICGNDDTDYGSYIEFHGYNRAWPDPDGTDRKGMVAINAGSKTNYTPIWITDNAFWANNHNFVTKQIRPIDTETYTLGTSSYKWKVIYNKTASVSTSDERLKQDITNIPDEFLDAWDEVNWQQFRFKSSYGTKGENARIHSGAIAQRIKEIFENKGIDPTRYGFFCYDEWDEKPEVQEKDKNGNVVRVRPARPAGNQYSLRYEEALCIEAAYTRRENKQLKEKISSLEKRIVLLEEALNQLLQ